MENLFLNDFFKILTSAIPLTVCVRLMGSAFILLVAVRAYFSQFPEVRLPKYPHNDNSGNSEQDELPPIIAPVEERALHTQPVLKEVKVRSFGRSKVFCNPSCKPFAFLCVIKSRISISMFYLQQSYNAPLYLLTPLIYKS